MPITKTEEVKWGEYHTPENGTGYIVVWTKDLDLCPEGYLWTGLKAVDSDIFELWGRSKALPEADICGYVFDKDSGYSVEDAELWCILHAVKLPTRVMAGAVGDFTLPSDVVGKAVNPLRPHEVRRLNDHFYVGMVEQVAEKVDGDTYSIDVDQYADRVKFYEEETRSDDEWHDFLLNVLQSSFGAEIIDDSGAAIQFRTDRLYGWRPELGKRLFRKQVVDGTSVRDCVDTIFGGDADHDELVRWLSQVKGTSLTVARESVDAAAASGDVVIGSDLRVRAGAETGLGKQVDRVADLMMHPDEFPMAYSYTIDLDERGEFAAHIDDPAGKTIWTIDTEGAQQMVEDGFVKWFSMGGYNRGTQVPPGLEEYLQEMGILPKGAGLVAKRVGKQSSALTDVVLSRLRYRLGGSATEDEWIAACSEYPVDAVVNAIDHLIGEGQVDRVDGKCKVVGKRVGKQGYDSSDIGMARQLVAWEVRRMLQGPAYTGRQRTVEQLVHATAQNAAGDVSEVAIREAVDWYAQGGHLRLEGDVVIPDEAYDWVADSEQRVGKQNAPLWQQETSPRELRVLGLMRQKPAPGLTVSDVIMAFGMDVAEAWQALDMLVDSGLARRELLGNTDYYEAVTKRLGKQETAYDTGLWTGDVEDAVMELVAGRTDPVTLDEIQAMMSVGHPEYDEAAILAALEQMVADGRAERSDEGPEPAWRITKSTIALGGVLPRRFVEAKKRCKIHKTVKFRKFDMKKGIVLGEVYVPREFDKQDDGMTQPDVETMAHDFMLGSRQVGHNHIEMLKGKAAIVESFIAGEGWQIDKESDECWTPGSWVLGTKLFDEGLKRDVKEGRITGYSIGGQGDRIELPRRDPKLLEVA